MSLLRLTGFGGMWPIRDPRALPDNAAVDATNIRVEGGAYLRSMRTVGFRKNLTAGTKSVYRIPLAGANTFVNSYWMEFADLDTDVVRAPVVNDQFERIYWASPSTGLKYSAKAMILAGTLPGGYLVGVTAPATAPLLGVAGGTSTLPLETREYYVTFISIYGEESQPSPPVEASGYSDSSWTLTSIPQPAVSATRPPLKYIRIYRTVVGTSGLTGFYKVIDLDIDTNNDFIYNTVTTYLDNNNDLSVSANAAAESTLWAVPPGSLQGLIGLPNGIFVSWKDNNIYFSENYRPHAWPAEYTIAVEDPIVGLGVFGNTCVVCTQGRPYTVSGTKASAMSLSKIDSALPCLSRRSIVSAPEGVYFASQNGLVLVGPNGIGVSTEQYISREAWQNEFAPATQRSMYVNGYLVTARDLVSAVNYGFYMKPAAVEEAGISYFSIAVPGVVNVGVEPWTGKGWLISTASPPALYEWNDSASAYLSYTWRSREFLYPKPCNFSVFQTYWDDSTGTTLHLKIWATLRSSVGGASKTLIYDSDVSGSGKEFKLPSGFKSDVWQFEFSGTTVLQEFLIGTAVADLRNAS